MTFRPAVWSETLKSLARFNTVRPSEVQRTGVFGYSDSGWERPCGRLNVCGTHARGHAVQHLVERGLSYFDVDMDQQQLWLDFFGRLVTQTEPNTTPEDGSVA
jgi:hypothetical protein